MKHAVFPPREAERLAELYRYEVLDTKPEKALDDLVHLAAYICQAPIAVISLVDADRQWFKSKIGLDKSQTSRVIAFCAQTILSDELMIVPDAQADKPPVIHWLQGSHIFAFTAVRRLRRRRDFASVP